MCLRRSTVTLILALAFCFGMDTAHAATQTFAPDTLAEFQTNGTIIYQLNSTTASSTLDNPTTEDPNELRFHTSISGADRLMYTHDLDTPLSPFSKA